MFTNPAKLVAQSARDNVAALELELAFAEAKKSDRVKEIKASLKDAKAALKVAEDRVAPVTQAEALLIETRDKLADEAEPADDADSDGDEVSE